MALIPKEELIELKSAADVKAVADEAIDIQEEQSVAYTINTAANTGEHSVKWQHPLSDKLLQKLEDKGYTVKKVPQAANPNYAWIIEGF